MGDIKHLIRFCDKAAVNISPLFCQHSSHGAGYQKLNLSQSPGLDDLPTVLWSRETSSETIRDKLKELD